MTATPETGFPNESAAAIPDEWVKAAEAHYSMHGAGLIRNILAGVAPLIAAAERERIAKDAGRLVIWNRCATCEALEARAEAAEAILTRIRELAESSTEDDGWGEPTAEMRAETEYARQILAIINDAEPADGAQA